MAIGNDCFIGAVDRHYLGIASIGRYGGVGVVVPLLSFLDAHAGSSLLDAALVYIDDRTAIL